MTPKQMVRDLVLVAVTNIQASPKNRTNEFLLKALGAVGMAADLGAINYYECDIAQKHLKTAAAWRGVNNFPYMERWQTEAIQAHQDFQDVWSK